jgi:hypothetical protein
MKNFVSKIFLALISVVTLCLGSGTALFSKPTLTPDVNDTWSVHVSTLKSNIRFYGRIAASNFSNGVTTLFKISGSLLVNVLMFLGLYSPEIYGAGSVSRFARTGPEALDIQDTTWSGPAASYMITRAVVGADTIEKGCIYVEDGIRKTKTIPRIEVANFIQKRAATPTSKGNVTVDGRKLTPADIMLYYEFNPRDYEQHFYAEQLQPKLLGRDLPVNAENFMMMQTMKRLNEFFENAIHRSRVDYDPDGANVDPTTKGEVAAASNYIYFDGLIKKLLDAASDPTYPTLSVATPVALTTSNIRDKMTAAINLLPQALIGKYGTGGVKFVMSYVDFLKYGEALRTDSYKNIRSDERAYNQYRGYDIETVAGMPENTFYLAIQKPDVESNTWLGINSTDDNKLELQRLQNNSELFFVKGLFKMDTQIGFPDQFVIYSTLTA